MALPVASVNPFSGCHRRDLCRLFQVFILFSNYRERRIAFSKKSSKNRPLLFGCDSSLFELPHNLLTFGIIMNHTFTHRPLFRTFCIAATCMAGTFSANVASASEPSMSQASDHMGKEIRTFARFVPERKDDFAWENDLIAFRAYGPALRDGKENSGIDAWLKRVDYPIINKWYKEAKEGKSYHKDHGEGLDNYHVGSSAGCGGTGIWLNGKREPLETYTKYEILESSPALTRFKLSYERTIDGTVYGEEKTISIELGNRLFQVDSLFTVDGKPAANLPVCVGLTTHDGAAESFYDKDAGWIATWEKLDDSELGTAARMNPKQIVSVEEVLSKKKDKSHIFLITNTDSEGQIRYEAGYGWKKAGSILSRDDWSRHLNN